jgi:acyl-CoA synthetase (AMP-forming)/AMP-acid ligase II
MWWMEKHWNILNASLPDYIVPSFFTQLDEIPLTSNGKLKKRFIADPLIEYL